MVLRKFSQPRLFELTTAIPIRAKTHQHTHVRREQKWSLDFAHPFNNIAKAKKHSVSLNFAQLSQQDSEGEVNFTALNEVSFNKAGILVRCGIQFNCEKYRSRGARSS